MPPDNRGEDVSDPIGHCSAMAWTAWSADEQAELPELRLLRELWRVADPRERSVLSAALTRAFAREHEGW